jgi:hypothetical protein
MTKAKTKLIETAAERYRRLRLERENSTETFDVTCECSMTWKCRKAAREMWVTSGVLPTDLAAKMVEARQKASDEAGIMKQLDPRDALKSIEFSAKVVLWTAVEPQIVEKDPTPEQIVREDVMQCCFQTLVQWQTSGGDEAASLGKFSRKR